MPWLWAVFTVAAAGGQVLRNAMQKELTATLGTVGATHVRFLFGLPFALLFLTIVLWATQLPMPALNSAMIVWTFAAALAQIAATALLLAAMQAALLRRHHGLCQDGAGAGRRLRPGLPRRQGDARPGARHPDRDGRRPHRVLAAQQCRGGLFLEAGSARHRLRRAVCHCRDRLSRRHPRARRSQLRGRRDHHAGAGPPHPDGDAHRLSLAGRPARRWSRFSAPGGRRCLPASWAPSPRRCGSWPSRSRPPPRCGPWRCVEILFAQVVSRNLFKQSVASREMAGIALIVLGVVLLLNL